MMGLEGVQESGRGRLVWSGGLMVCEEGDKETCVEV